MTETTYSVWCICLLRASVVYFMVKVLLLSPGRRLGLYGSSGKETTASSERNFSENSSIGSSLSPGWLKTLQECTEQNTHCRIGDVRLPLTSPGPAIQGGSCGCCRAQWVRGAGGCMPSHPGLSPLSPRSSFYIKLHASARLRYSCDCTQTIRLSTSWRQS